MTDHPLSQRISAVLGLAPDAPALEFDDQWFTWRDLAEAASRTRALVSPGAQFGMMLRNRPAHVAAFLGVLLSGGCVVVVNPARGDERIQADLDALQLPVIVGEPDDLAKSRGAGMAVAIADLHDEPQISGTVSGGPPSRPGVAVRMLTSGTTGPPKRIDLTYDMLARSVIGVEFENPPRLTDVRSGVAIVSAPLVHIGGVFRVLQCVVEARPFALLERFELRRWAAAVRKHRPGAVSPVPSALRMVLHSDLTRDDLAGIRAVTSGTAPLSAEDADAFTAKFGIPVLTSYAATEFGGGVAGWSLADYQAHWHAKRGSVGRPTLGAQLRVVGDDGTPLGTDEVGLLEVKPGQFGTGSDWIRTADLARIDADGFLWVLGRADQAIIRGGFKVIPDDVRSALESHPAVQGAAVIGRPDDRLGETPVAMVELRSGASADPDQLADFLRSRLAGYEIPTDVAIVDAIPRTPSGKPDMTSVRD